MKYSYVRVSTVNQDLQSQLVALEKKGAAIFFEDKFTVTKKGRPEFNQLLIV